MSLPFQSSFLARQVYIRMKPPPRNLAQSRAVYKALQKFGEISSFLNLKHYQIRSPTRGRTAFAIFETSQAAENAINASPLIVPLTTDSVSHSNFTTPSRSPTSHLGRFESESDGHEENIDPVDHHHDDDPNPNSISCTIQTTGYDHKASMRMNPYNMSFKLSRNWFEVHDLMDRQIGAVPMIEYADCFTRRKMSVPYRAQDKIFKENEEKGATSLMKLYKRGMERKEKEGRIKGDDQSGRGEIKEGN